MYNNSAFYPSEVDKWEAGPFNRMCAVAPSGECLRGESWMLDVGNTLAPSVSGSLRARPCCGCSAWQIV